MTTAPPTPPENAHNLTSGESTRQISIIGNRLASSELFALTRELVITHGAETYRLRLTSQNKLILTK